MEIIELTVDQLGQIEGLWNELNSLHGELSTDFSEHFTAASFNKRRESLEQKEELVLFLAKLNEEPIAYCIASIHQDKGEIDSLYVKPEHQGRRIGEDLMRLAVRWLELEKPGQIEVYVAQGNEAVLSFYERYGFKKRSHVLQLGIDDSGFR